MQDIYLFNSLTRKKEKFEPIVPGKVGIYTCGPTVYNLASIGNFRTYVSADLLVRTLKYFGYDVSYVMNFTDVGHLTGDNLGDADTGEDRIEKSAKCEGKTAWEIAEFYEKAFIKDFGKLNLVKPKLFAKATDHISEQINLVKKLEEKGFTYRISDGIYFDTVEFEKRTGKKYGELSTLDTIKEGTRVEPNPEKRNPRDFALWKFSPKGEKRQMEWDSPWEIGFPGWHIECSAMSMKYLGEHFDIHFGGEDLRQTHHPNEIAQSEGAIGKTFVNYWLHGTFLKVDGKRMGKSLGNVYTISDLEEKGYDALAIRYLFLTANYRDPLNFTWESLTSAQNSLNNLQEIISGLKETKERTALSNEKLQKTDEYRQRFESALADDINVPQALTVLWEMLKSSIPAGDKYDLVLSFDEVLGLNLAQISNLKSQIPNNIKTLMEKREQLRKAGKFEEADKIRIKIQSLGFKVKDEKIS